MCFHEGVGLYRAVARWLDVRAGGKAWEAVTDGLPDQAVVAVDKSRQRFFLMEKGKPVIICVQPGRRRATNRYAAT